MAKYEVRLSKMVADQSKQRGYRWELAETFTVEAATEWEANEQAAEFAELTDTFYQVREIEHEQ